MTTIGVVACAAPVPPGGSPPTTVPDTPATTLWGTPPLPDRLVAVGDDGALVVVDTATGERVVELADADTPGLDGGAIAGVTQATDGTTAWFDIRRPGGGLIYQVPTDGTAEPVQAAVGTYPEVSPSGAQLAFVGQGAIVVHGVITDEELRWPQTGRLTDVAWTTDGNGLLWIRDRTELVWLDIASDAEPEVLATAGAGETLSLPLGQLSDSGSVTVLVNSGPDDPTPERLVVRLGSEPTRSPETLGFALDRAYDPSGWWGLRVTSSHTIRWSGSGGIGTIATGYTAADF